VFSRFFRILDGFNKFFKVEFHYFLVGLGKYFGISGKCTPPDFITVMYISSQIGPLICGINFQAIWLMHLQLTALKIRLTIAAYIRISNKNLYLQYENNHRSLIS